MRKLKALNQGLRTKMSRVGTYSRLEETVCLWKVNLLGYLVTTALGCDTTRLCADFDCKPTFDAGGSRPTEAQSTSDSTTEESTTEGESTGSSGDQSSRTTGVDAETSQCDAGTEACNGDHLLLCSGGGNDGECVPCELETNRGCGGARPYCVEVEPSPEASSVIRRVACAECLENEDCDDETPWCIGNRCAACSRDEDCTSPLAPRCNEETGQCDRCTDVGQCAHVTGATACDVERGRCVECTREESDACGAHVCAIIPGQEGYLECSDYEIGSTEQCGECVSDEQCAPLHKCVAEVNSIFPNELTGKYHCMILEDALGPGKTWCADNRPFVHAFSAVSVGGVEANYCTIRRASCTAFNLFGETPDIVPDGETNAGEPRCLNDDSCGLPGMWDGVCDISCTYRCGSTEECPIGTSCLYGICLPE